MSVCPCNFELALFRRHNWFQGIGAPQHLHQAGRFAAACWTLKTPLMDLTDDSSCEPAWYGQNTAIKGFRPKPNDIQH